MYHAEWPLWWAQRIKSSHGERSAHWRPTSEQNGWTEASRISERESLHESPSVWPTFVVAIQSEFVLQKKWTFCVKWPIRNKLLLAVLQDVELRIVGILVSECVCVCVMCLCIYICIYTYIYTYIVLHILRCHTCIWLPYHTDLTYSFLPQSEKWKVSN